MDTYLTVHRITFPVPEKENSKIKTMEFLSACSDFLKLIDLLGKSFAPAIYDISGNIAKITNVYQDDCDKYEYLEDMVLAERVEGKQLATDALMWLRRALNFLIAFFELLCTDESKQEDLGAFVREAYSNTLKMYHGWITKSLFNVCYSQCPLCLCTDCQFLVFGRNDS
uniref:Glycolipid transfer protein domain-containing protein n=1 Tax=Photinus pyralis TaxID=7054 RepID=A0A1Y1L0I0_PHOPY